MLIQPIKSSNDFGRHLRRYVAKFKQTLYEDDIALPEDSLISKAKMQQRIEACCLLFKKGDRILRALHDLRDMGRYVTLLEPEIMLPTGESACLAIDLDHVFLVEYVLRAGTVAKLVGFHVDYLGEIEMLGMQEPHRLIIEKNGVAFNGIEESFLTLHTMRSPKKSLFPRNWDWWKCLNCAVEALDNIVFDKFSKRGDLIVIGLCSELIAIQLVIDMRCERIKTFFPNIDVTKDIHERWQIQ